MKYLIKKKKTMSFSSYLKIKLSKQGVNDASSIEITYSAIF